MSASSTSREPVLFLYVPAGPGEESLQLNCGHDLAPRMANGTPSTYTVLLLEISIIHVVLFGHVVPGIADFCSKIVFFSSDLSFNYAS